jgi:crotonobetainyl-CoA:carnitine CoA-transferase CaiB-like acyl-CoA transferase
VQQDDPVDVPPAGLPPLYGVRVVEVGATIGEYCGLLLAGLGAEVVKVEPPEGAASRRIGPWVADEPHPDRSLFHWAYNRGKRSVSIDGSTAAGADRLGALAASADVWIESVEQASSLPDSLAPAQLRAEYPSLVVARLSPFGDDGPWRDYRGTDLIHLALGGVLMNCGYDPTVAGEYDLPPAWPHAFHAMHIAGEQLAMSIIAALYWRLSSHAGQYLSGAVHEAVSKATEVDLMSWVMLRAPFHRQTARHSAPQPVTAPTVAQTKDGRWLNAMTLSAKDRVTLRTYLADAGFGEAPVATTDGPSLARKVPGTGTMGSEDELRDIELVGRLTRKARFDDLPWLDAQANGVMWAPVRKPNEQLGDPHWGARGTFAAVTHDGVEVPLVYPASKWASTSGGWVAGFAARSVGQDNELLDRLPAVDEARPAPGPLIVTTPDDPSRRQQPWALSGVRIFDFSWFLASAGATRFLAALGADCIKVEWHAHPDTRLGAGAPVGGRDARRVATEPMTAINDPDMGGNFNHKNAGKRGISLNVRHPEGLEIARELIRKSDIVAEGFSPGVMDRWGLGYEALRELRPDIIYAQQSGMGAAGTYGRTRAVGPIAGALSGLTEMSGAPDPAPPAGWGYSYLDWLGAYSFATAMLAALVHRERTGEGQYIDASQTEVGIFTTAVPILDWQVNRRPWRRTGNRSPYLKVAPEGVYRCAGVDRWIAISCVDDAMWRQLAPAIGRADLTDDRRYRSTVDRLARADELDAMLGEWSRTRDGYQVMHDLQRAGVAAGVCQTAEDRCDHDPQLASLGWLSEITGTKIGTWPVGEYPVRMSETPGSIAGPTSRGAPCYGEDNYAVYAELLGLSETEIDGLSARGVI